MGRRARREQARKQKASDLETHLESQLDPEARELLPYASQVERRRGTLPKLAVLRILLGPDRERLLGPARALKASRA